MFIGKISIQIISMRNKTKPDIKDAASSGEIFQRIECVIVEQRAVILSRDVDYACVHVAS